MTIGYIIQLIDENSPSVAQALDDKAVVYHFMAYIDRCAQEFKGALHDLDRAIDSGAKSPGIGK
jgi:hypothetical protein